MDLLTQSMTTSMVIIGLIGNSLSITVVNVRRMRSQVSVYLTGLAVWDIVLLLMSEFLLGLTNVVAVSYTHLTLPTTPYV